MSLSSRPFRFLGEEAKASLQRRMDEAVRVWSVRWRQTASCPVALKLETSSSVSATRAGTGDWFLVDAVGRGAMWARIAPGTAEHLLQVMLGDSGLHNAEALGEMSRKLGMELISDLIADVVGRTQAPSAWTPQMPDASVYRRASGAGFASLTFSNLCVDIVLSAQCISSFAKPAAAVKAARPRLARLSEAVTSGSIKLKAGIEIEGGLTFQAVAELAVGDVVLLDPSITVPWLLTTTDGDRVGRCQIGRQQQRLAVQILDR